MTLTGGCMCGAVRYELLSAPFDCGWCHCRNCQLATGAPALVFATVPKDDLLWTTGVEKLKTIVSAPFGQRAFCSDCGTALLITVDYQPDTVDITAATLDEPSAVYPSFNIFWSSRVPWFGASTSLPKYDRLRPDTRGLEGSERPA